MKLLDLDKGTVVFDDEDWSILRNLTIYIATNGYAMYSIWQNGRSTPYLVHRLLMQPPQGTHVDHVNGNKLDNRRCNLRIATPRQNQVNRKSLNRNNTSGHRGVAYRPNMSKRKPWHAQIHTCGKGIHLGNFATEAEALEARRNAELLYFGELCP